MNTHCDHVDDFLSNSLSAIDLSDFELHLDTCESCRLVIAQDQQIRSLLNAAVLSEAVPSGLTGKVRCEIHVAHDRRLARSVLLAVSAVVLIAISLTLSSGRKPNEDRDHQANSTATIQTPGATIEEEQPGPGTRLIADEQLVSVPTVEIQLPPNVIGVRVETKHPNVTIMMVYPTQRFALPDSNQ